MVRPVITNSLKGSLGQTYYKELCSQRGWAYCSLENLHGYNLDSVLFKKGFDRLRVYIPKVARLYSERNTARGQSDSYAI